MLPLKILPYYITNDFFEPPVIVDLINPSLSRQSFTLGAAAWVAGSR